ncbi:unnamed protein product [Mytilus edulis]|uniref:Uncharacterized protein n=1 Tax=Mytilus edulis TaxID=6550 RepID=A0A8S3S485_MYTED|nr:unnamed protein product [Mytilus edulis]
MTGLDARSIPDHSLLYCELNISASLPSCHTSGKRSPEFIKFDVKNIPSNFCHGDDIHLRLLDTINGLETNEVSQCNIDQVYTDFCAIVSEEMNQKLHSKRKSDYADLLNQTGNQVTTDRNIPVDQSPAVLTESDFLLTEEISFEEVFNVCKAKRCASGVDNIPADVLCNQNCIIFLHRLFNCVLKLGAVSAMTRALAIDEAMYNVRVNAVSPGPTRTPSLVEVVNQSSDPKARMQELENHSVCVVFLTEI